MNGRLWTKEEDQLLRELWSHASREAICAAVPNRSWDAIWHQARKNLGLRRPRSASWKRARTVDPVFLKLREMRERAGMTREELADKAGFHKVMLAKYEIGEMRPRWLMLRCWLDALGVELKVVPNEKWLTRQLVHKATSLRHSA